MLLKTFIYMENLDKWPDIAYSMVNKSVWHMFQVDVRHWNAENEQFMGTNLGQNLNYANNMQKPSKDKWSYW